MLISSWCHIYHHILLSMTLCSRLGFETLPCSLICYWFHIIHNTLHGTCHWAEGYIIILYVTSAAFMPAWSVCTLAVLNILVVHYPKFKAWYLDSTVLFLITASRQCRVTYSIRQGRVFFNTEQLHPCTLFLPGPELDQPQGKKEIGVNCALSFWTLSDHLIF